MTYEVVRPTVQMALWNHTVSTTALAHCHLYESEMFSSVWLLIIERNSSIEFVFCFRMTACLLEQFLAHLQILNADLESQMQGLTLVSDIGHLTDKICKCPIDVSCKRTNVLLICYKGGHCPIISSFTRTLCVCVCVCVCVCIWDLSLTSVLCVRYLNYFVYCFLSWH